MAIFHIPIRAQITELYDAVQSGLLLLPLLGSSAVGAASAGIISHRKNFTFWVMGMSSILMIVASVLLSQLPESTSSLPAQRGYLAILGLGAGMNIATTTLLAALHSEIENHGMQAQHRLSRFLHCTKRLTDLKRLPRASLRR